MKKLIALWLATSLAASGSAQVPPPGEAVPDYHATFEGENLGCCILRDVFHKRPQPLGKGKSNLGETAIWTTKDGALQMMLTAPATITRNAEGDPTETPSMGIFGTGHDFGADAKFTIKATFQRPVGTLSGKAWSVAVVGRTGGVADTSDLQRIQLSFRTCTTGIGACKTAKANLRIQEVNSADPNDPATVKHDSVDITDAVYDEIFNKGQPFTLTLFVDRKNGLGVATMTTGNETIRPLRFNTTIFTPAADAPMITTAGATLANGYGDGETVSVEVTDFKLWGPKNRPFPHTTPSIRKPIPKADPSRRPTGWR
jgi:hypothetical protein